MHFIAHPGYSGNTCKVSNIIMSDHCCYCLMVIYLCKEHNKNVSLIIKHCNNISWVKDCIQLCSKQCLIHYNNMSWVIVHSMEGGGRNSSFQDSNIDCCRWQDPEVWPLTAYDIAVLFEYKVHLKLLAREVQGCTSTDFRLK